MKAIWGVEIYLGLNMLGFISVPEDLAKAKRNFDNALSGEIVRLTEAYGDEALQRSHWDNIYAPLRDVNGEIIGVLTQCFDISEKVRNETTIQQQREELERMVEDRT